MRHYRKIGAKWERMRVPYRLKNSLEHHYVAQLYNVLTESHIPKDSLVN